MNLHDFMLHASAQQREKVVKPLMLKPVVQEKIVEKPQYYYQTVFIDDPHVKVIEKKQEDIYEHQVYQNKYVKKNIYVEKIKHVPKVITREKLVEIPHYVFRNKYVETPIYVNKTKIVENPTPMVIERMMPKLHIEKKETVRYEDNETIKQMFFDCRNYENYANGRICAMEKHQTPVPNHLNVQNKKPFVNEKQGMWQRSLFNKELLKNQQLIICDDIFKNCDLCKKCCTLHNQQQETYIDYKPIISNALFPNTELTVFNNPYQQIHVKKNCESVKEVENTNASGEGEKRSKKCAIRGTICETCKSCKNRLTNICDVFETFLKKKRNKHFKSVFGCLGDSRRVKKDCCTYDQEIDEVVFSFSLPTVTETSLQNQQQKIKICNEKEGKEGEEKKAESEAKSEAEADNGTKKQENKDEDKKEDICFDEEINTFISSVEKEEKTESILSALKDCDIHFILKTFYSHFANRNPRIKKKSNRSTSPSLAETEMRFRNLQHFLNVTEKCAKSKKKERSKKIKEMKNVHSTLPSQIENGNNLQEQKKSVCETQTKKKDVSEHLKSDKEGIQYERAPNFHKLICKNYVENFYHISQYSSTDDKKKCSTKENSRSSHGKVSNTSALQEKDKKRTPSTVVRKGIKKLSKYNSDSEMIKGFKQHEKKQEIRNDCKMDLSKMIDKKKDITKKSQHNNVAFNNNNMKTPEKADTRSININLAKKENVHKKKSNVVSETNFNLNENLLSMLQKYIKTLYMIYLSLPMKNATERNEIRTCIIKACDILKIYLQLLHNINNRRRIQKNYYLNNKQYVKHCPKTDCITREYIKKEYSKKEQVLLKGLILYITQLMNMISSKYRYFGNKVNRSINELDTLLNKIAT